MRKYADDQERLVRLRHLIDEWKRSALLDAAQHERIAADLAVDLRRTNRFLRLTLLGFSLLIITATVGLVGVTLDVTSSAAAGTLCVMAAVICAGLAEGLIGHFRLYRFGVEEACAVSAAALAAAGAGLFAGSWDDGSPVNRLLLVGLIAGAAAAFAVYARYGYVYAAAGAMLCAALVPFQLRWPEMVQRLVAAAILGGCFAAARMGRLRHGDEFPGDERGTLQAVAWFGLYAALNVELLGTATVPAPFRWFTYAAILTLPAAGLWLGIRQRDRQLLDTSLVMALATIVTSKPYLGAARKPWDPILLGVLLMGAAIALRRWLASGEAHARSGLTAVRLVRSDSDALGAVAVASAVFHQEPAHAHDDPSRTDAFKEDGGRSGGGGAGASY